MVDLKRIDDLPAENGSLGSKSDCQRSVQTYIRDQAIKWSSKVERIIVQNNHYVLEYLTLARHERPKGVRNDVSIPWDTLVSLH
jgi:hypothetical protein